LFSFSDSIEGRGKRNRVSAEKRDLSSRREKEGGGDAGVQQTPKGRYSQVGGNISIRRGEKRRAYLRHPVTLHPARERGKKRKRAPAFDFHDIAWEGRTGPAGIRRPMREVRPILKGRRGQALDGILEKKLLG